LVHRARSPRLRAVCGPAAEQSISTGRVDGKGAEYPEQGYPGEPANAVHAPDIAAEAQRAADVMKVVSVGSNAGFTKMSTFPLTCKALLARRQASARFFAWNGA
jgi:hypothetical protein